MMRKVDEILNGSNRENCLAPMEYSRQTTDGSRSHSWAGAQPRSRLSFESNHRERPRAALSRAGWTNPARQKWMPHRGHVYRRCRKSYQCQIWLPPRMIRRCTLQCLSLWLDLWKHSSPNSRSLLREERGHEGHSKSRNRTSMSQMAASIPG